MKWTRDDIQKIFKQVDSAGESRFSSVHLCSDNDTKMPERRSTDTTNSCSVFTNK